jgi:hypothetical protein
MSGISSAICSAFGRASVLMRRISAWTSAGWPASSSVRCVFVITSAFFSRPLETCVCSAGVSTLLEFAMLVKINESEASMIAPAKASPNERPNEPPAE